MVRKAQADLEAPKGDDVEVVVKRMPVANLPASLKDTEPPELYPAFLPCDHDSRYPMIEVFKYRGADHGSYKTVSAAGGKGKPIQEKAYCMISMEDVLTNSEDDLLGWPQTQYDSDNAHRRCVQVMVRMDTQYPCLTLRIARPEKGAAPVYMEIFANSLARSPDGSRMGLAYSGGLNGAIDVDTLPEHPHIAKLHQAGKLWRLEVKLYDPNQKPRMGPVGEPIFHGISPEELERIRGASLTDNTPYWERVIARLSASRKFSILRTWPSDWAPTKPFTEFFLGCMYAVTQYGNWWWYSLAAGGATSSVSFSFGTEIPRWLIRMVEVTYHDDKAVEYKPAEIVSFDPLPSGVYPDPDTVAFAYRLGMSREIQKQDRNLDRLCSRSEGAVTAIIKPFHVDGEYIVSLRFNSLNAWDHETILPPELRRKCTIGVMHCGKEVKLVGFVCEDPFDLGRHIAVVANMETKGVPPFSDDHFEHNVSVEFQHDVKLINCAMNAVCALQNGQSRRKGAFMPEICFNKPVPSNAQVNWTSDVYKHGMARKWFTTILDQYGLNDNQKQAAVNIIESKDGLNLIGGPSGTGKTRAMAVILYALVTLGHRVVFTAPTNSAVKNAARAFAKVCRPDQEVAVSNMIEDQDYCRFTGGHYSMDWAGQIGNELAAGSPEAVFDYGHMDIDEDDVEDLDRDLLGLEAVESEIEETQRPHEQPDEDFWEEQAADQAAGCQREMNVRLYPQIASPSAEPAEEAETWDFPKRKMAYVLSILKVPWDEAMPAETRDLQHRARQYTALVNKLRAKKDTKSFQARRAFKGMLLEFTALDKFWTEQFLKQCKAIFVTNSTSCHEVLGKFFRPTVLMSDDAGQSTPADAMIPMAAFKGTLREIVLAGDHEYVMPVVLSKGANEALPWVTRSLFLTAKDAAAYERKIVMFDTQYRMSPDLSSFLSTAVYDGKLQDADVVAETNETRQQFRALMNDVRPAWNGRLRAAFHVNCEAQVWGGSTSYANSGEADFCVELAGAQIAAGIAPEDIFILTPYTGQQRMIRKLILAKSDDEHIQCVTVASTKEAQGRGAKSVIVSMVRNNPEDPMELGFIYEKHLLCVELSRAKDVLCLIGNFSGWCEELEANAKDSFLIRVKAQTFRSLIEDLMKKKDILYAKDFQRAQKRGGPIHTTFYKDVRKRARGRHGNAYGTGSPSASTRGTDNQLQNTGEPTAE